MSNELADCVASQYSNNDNLKTMWKTAIINTLLDEGKKFKLGSKSSGGPTTSSSGGASSSSLNFTNLTPKIYTDVNDWIDKNQTDTSVTSCKTKLSTNTSGFSITKMVQTIQDWNSDYLCILTNYDSDPVIKDLVENDVIKSLAENSQSNFYFADFISQNQSNASVAACNVIPTDSTTKSIDTSTVTGSGTGTGTGSGTGSGTGTGTGTGSGFGTGSGTTTTTITDIPITTVTTITGTPITASNPIAKKVYRSDLDSVGEQIGTYLNGAGANLPNTKQSVSLDYTAGDFFYFQPYDIGQFSPSEQSRTQSTTTRLDISCTETDMSFVDASMCYPEDPGFVKFWSNENNESWHKQCFRSHTCANSQLSKKLSILTSEKGGQETRSDDLVDIYYYNCFQLFNFSVAILFFVVFIIWKVRSHANVI